MAGKTFSALLSFVFVPWYVKLLGAEAFGLIGLFTTLQSVFMFADVGLSGAFNREIARLSGGDENAERMRNLSRTFEAIFIFVGSAVALVIVLLSPALAAHGLRAQQLAASTVSGALPLIGIAVGLQFPFFIHQGCMQGLQRQTQLNAVVAGVGLLRGLGAVLVLSFVMNTIQAFFWWQVAASVIQLVAGHFLMWRSLPAASGPPRSDLRLVVPLWRFAAGMAGITLSGVILTQIDKLVLAKMLPLEAFGYYSLAGVVASVPNLVVVPFHSAVYPRFTQLVAARRSAELIHLYHRSCEVMAVPLLPIGLFLVFFAREIVLAWTGSPVTAANTSHLISVLGAGTTLSALMSMPYALQLAFGWTRLSLVFNYASIVLLVPLMVVLASKYGALGASSMWLLLNAAYVLGMIHVMHWRILPGEKRRWYVHDVGRPLVAALGVVLVGRLLVGDGMTRASLVVWLVLLLALAMGAAGASVPAVRARIAAAVGCPAGAPSGAPPAAGIADAPVPGANLREGSGDSKGSGDGDRQGN